LSRPSRLRSASIVSLETAAPSARSFPTTTSPGANEKEHGHSHARKRRDHQQELTGSIPEHGANAPPGLSAGTSGHAPAPAIRRRDGAPTDRARPSTSPGTDSGWASCTSL